MSGQASGFTLVEVVIALFLVAVTVIGLAPLFVFASRENVAAGALGSAGALAVRRMEQLRGTDFNLLVLGGDLASDVSGYFEAPATDSRVRWTVEDKPGTSGAAKIITVRALRMASASRAARDAVLVTVRSN